MPADEDLALVRQVYDLWNERDLDAAVELAAEDVEIRLVATDRTLRGRDGFRRFMERFATASSDMRKAVTNQVAAGGQVVSEFRLRGTHDGPLETAGGEVPPTGRVIELDVVEVIEIRDGVLSRIRNYSDTTTLLCQLGLVEQVAGPAAP